MPHASTQNLLVSTNVSQQKFEFIIIVDILKKVII